MGKDILERKILGKGRWLLEWRGSGRTSTAGGSGPNRHGF
jgi:hypothetical protein